MDQAEFWRRCEQDFLRYSNEENERLVVRWEASDDDVWTFEGPLYCARAFKALAKQGGYGLAKKRSLDAWKDWLDALRRHGYDSRVPQTQEARVSEQEQPARGLLAAVQRRKPGALTAAFRKRQAAAAESAMLSFKASAGVINTPFKNSALFCFELATEASNELDGPDETVASQGFDWTTFLLDPAVELNQQESDAVDLQGEASSEPTLEANSGEAAAQEATVANSGHRTNQTAVVDHFLIRCNQESAVGFKVKRKHIWLAAGHAQARQFQYWQEGSDKATDEDDRNFHRILSTPPAEFLALLKKKNIGP